MKSTSGVWLMCGTSLLRSWSSTQNTIALSAAEAELCATSKRAQHALHLKSMGEDFGVVVEPLIRRNASAALGIACQRGLAGKTRHVQCSTCGRTSMYNYRRCWVATSAHEVLPPGRARAPHRPHELLVHECRPQSRDIDHGVPAHLGVGQEAQVFQQVHRAGTSQCQLWHTRTCAVTERSFCVCLVQAIECLKTRCIHSFPSSLFFRYSSLLHVVSHASLSVRLSMRGRLWLW